MTSEELKRLEELCEKATPGPWHSSAGSHVIQTAHVTRDVWHICDCLPLSLNHTENYYSLELHANKEFIAAARTAVPELIAEVRRLKERCEIADKAVLEVCTNSNKAFDDYKSKLAIAKEALEFEVKRCGGSPKLAEALRKIKVETVL